MPTTFANTIDGNEILAKRSQCDYAGNDIQTTYATKSELPTATSDLTNDSDFITSSDVPVKDVQVGGESVVNAQGIAEISIPQTGVLDVEVDGSSVVNAQGVAEIVLPTFTQVNADWDATSGVSEILNKPDLSIYAESSDLATVATSGSYNDLLDKPSIPSAQVNADWDATSGVSAILNKPNLATVATTGDYSDLQNLPSIPAAQVNSDWAATSGVAQILNKPTIPSYTAGTGVDITSGAISVENPLPSSTPSDEGKVLKVDANGDPEWSTGGGGTQVNSDWDATSGVAEVLNKPDLSVYATTSAMNAALADKQDTLTAGTNVSISNNVISATDTTYTAGTGISITNDEISVETPVDIVAGPGIVIDNPDGNTLRVSTDENYEVELLSSPVSTPATTVASTTLTETVKNFEYIAIYGYTDDGAAFPFSVRLTVPQSVSGDITWSCAATNSGYVKFILGKVNGTSLTLSKVKALQWGGGWADPGGTWAVTKVVGIHRINGGN